MADRPEPRARRWSLLGVQVLAAGGFLPDNIVTNEQLRDSLGCDSDWLVQRTGIRARRHAPPGMGTREMAVQAALKCIERANVNRADIDLLIVGTFSPDMHCPSTACLVQHDLGLCAPAFDIQAACAGFMYAIATGMQYVKTGASKLALVIGADCNSRILDPLDVKTYPLFGDGAGAVLLAPGDESQGFLSFEMGTDGGGASLLHRPIGGVSEPITHENLDQRRHFLLMDGRAVFKWAVRVVEDSSRETLRAAGKTIDDVRLAIFHQANTRILDSAVEKLGIEKSRVFNNLERYGNTSAASIPLALAEALDLNRVSRGDLLLLSGFGAGLAWGTGLLRW